MNRSHFYNCMIDVHVSISFVFSGYDSSGQPTSTVGIESFSESELQTATDDFEKKPLDTIPEGGAGKSGDVIITDPCTEIESYTQESREEVTRQ